jgi:hypothetical protein
MSELLQKIKKYIEQNYKEKSEEIYLDSDYELPDEVVAAILNSDTKIGVVGAIDEEFIKIYDANYEDKTREILDDIETEFDEEWEELSEDDIDELRGYITHKGIVYLDFDNVGQDIEVNIFPLNDPAQEEFDFYGIDDLIEINNNIGNPYGWSMPESSRNLLEIMKILQINPYEVGVLLQEKGDIEVNTFPNIEYSLENKNTPASFLEELENASSGNSFMITLKLSLSDYVNNFEKYEDRGITIPDGARCGFINTVNGSCSFVSDLFIPSELNLKKYHMYYEDKMPGYGLDEIAGVVRSYYWNKNVSWSKTFEEETFIKNCKTVETCLGTKPSNFKRSNDAMFSALCSFLEATRDIVLNKGVEAEIYDEATAKILKYYWVKDKGEEFIESFKQNAEKILEVIKKGDSETAVIFVENMKYNLDGFYSPLQSKIKLWNEKFVTIPLPQMVAHYIEETLNNKNTKEELWTQAAKVKDMLLNEFKSSDTFDKDYRIVGESLEKFDLAIEEIGIKARAIELAIKKKDHSEFKAEWDEITAIIKNDLEPLLNINGFHNESSADAVARIVDGRQELKSENLQ